MEKKNNFKITHAIQKFIFKKSKKKKGKIHHLYKTLNFSLLLLIFIYLFYFYLLFIIKITRAPRVLTNLEFILKLVF